MILAKAWVIREQGGRVSVGLTLPTGFDPEEVVQESVRGNGEIAPEGFRIPPRTGRSFDIFREFEVTFAQSALVTTDGRKRTLQITGHLRRGLPFRAFLTIVDPAQDPPGDH